MTGTKNVYPISELTKSDLQEAVDLTSLCFGENRRAAAAYDFSLSFDSYPLRPKTFVMHKDNQIIGAMQSLSAYIHFNTQSFAWLCVHPDYRKQGLGKALLAYAEQETITRKFKNKAGTFLLVAAYDPAYYAAAGYKGDLQTHSNEPLMVKHYKP
ncbi:MAG TPA: GNAT family N-acetyltransferase [Micavibrio sp.]|jgi:GNAT superfamily N-acetyltransferase